MKGQYEDSAKKCAILAVISIVVALIFFNVADSIQSEWGYYFSGDAQGRYKVCDTLAKIMMVLFAASAVGTLYYFYKAHETQITENLAACPDCGRMLSRQAKMCPRCGRELKPFETTGEKEAAGNRGGVGNPETTSVDENNGTRKSVRPILTGDMIICPVCDAMQRKDRTCCYKCSALFLKDEKAE